MGLLSLGTPLPWHEAQKYSDDVRRQGVAQFLEIWRRQRGRRGDALLWGDEIEYMVVKYDHAQRRVRLSLRAAKTLEALQTIELDAIDRGATPAASWKPEFGRYMLEATPGTPYGPRVADLLAVEENMRSRRRLAAAHLGADEALMALTNFPLLGTYDSLAQATPRAAWLTVEEVARLPTHAAGHTDGGAPVIVAPDVEAPIVASDPVRRSANAGDGAPGSNDPGDDGGDDDDGDGNRDGTDTGPRDGSRGVERAPCQQLRPPAAAPGLADDGNRRGGSVSPSPSYGSQSACSSTAQWDDALPLAPTPTTGVFQSFFLPDDAITGHARFPTLAKNIRERRTGKVAINVPVFHDTHTPRPWREPCPPSLGMLDAPRRAQALVDATSIDKVRVAQHPFCLPGNEAATQHMPLCALLPDALEDHIYMDAMCFGMGCSCLQVTFQADGIDEARKLYDQLAVLTPVFLALSAAAPIFRGYLADVDCRWDVISASVDDRTPYERGQASAAATSATAATTPANGERFRISKSRYASLDSYLGTSTSTNAGNTGANSTNTRGAAAPANLRSAASVGPSSAPSPLAPLEPEARVTTPAPAADDGCRGALYPSDYFDAAYNDLPLTVDPAIEATLRDAGVDLWLARHVAHLFIRDPLVVFHELLDQDPATSSDHFENIQSTNWQTMRFKPPPPHMPDVGWRVEFRSMEIQLTEFENAAFAVFLVLVARMLAAFDVNLYLPLSRVDQNLARAQRRDALSQETFWCRQRILPHHGNRQPGYAALSIDTIINGASHVAARRRAREPPSAAGAAGSAVDSAADSAAADAAAAAVPPFPGLVPLVNTFLDTLSLAPAARARLDRYLHLVSARASGALPTNAAWIRAFVRRHPQYAGDSRVPEAVAHDLCCAMQACVDRGDPTLSDMPLAAVAANTDRVVMPLATAPPTSGPPSSAVPPL